MAFRRWHSSLPSLGRLGAAEVQPSGSRLAPRPSVGSNLALSAGVPDFLAPALTQGPTRQHRTYASTSAARPFSIEYTAPQTVPITTRSPQSLDAATLIQDQTDFSSFCDTEASTIGLASAMAPLEAARDEQEVIRAADQIYKHPLLVQERRRAKRLHKKGTPPDETWSCKLPCNEHFVLSLFSTAFSITKASGKDDVQAMSWTITRTLQAIAQAAHATSLSPAFLCELAGYARAEAARTTLKLLLTMIDDRLASAPAPNAQLSLSHRDHLSRTLRRLMMAFSELGDFDRTQKCFELLQKHALDTDIRTFQSEFIALCQKVRARSDHADPKCIANNLEYLQQQLLLLKRQMDERDIAMDDTFLATIVHSFSAPLRTHSAASMSRDQVAAMLQVVRAIAARSMDSAAESATSPRLFGAIVQAEIDAMAHLRTQGRSRLQPPRRISTLMHELRTRKRPRTRRMVGMHDRKHVDEWQLTELFLRLRLAAALGDMGTGKELLRELLAIKPLQPSTPSARDLLIKQRSSVVALFSAAMRRRPFTSDGDEALAVLRIGFGCSSTDFHEVWTGVQRPANFKPKSSDDAWQPSITVLRLWRRWMGAWREESIAHSQRTDPETLSHVSDDASEHLAVGGTYAFKNPWRTMKDALTILDINLTHYEQRNSQQDRRARRRFAWLFRDKVVLDSVVRVCLTGGRRRNGVGMDRFVDRRLDVLIRTLARVDAPARVWERLEASMLHHLSRIDPTVMPTERVVLQFDQIKALKRKALLRNTDLLKAYRDQQHQPQHPLETGSVTVLRHMLNQQHQQPHPNPQPAIQPCLT
ncbi:hypothetical protein PANT_27d00013 [Moesziomyces antarcticus T-34]|uniref:Uncharacterized protein n=1 Tax=Pseudozyma antarctica (strain T-34) TaxID=1151754 RepID=M9MJ52_PSEA3|nr:hypothetical protein PANT_27d00013 [Moesziomyces antarcticus T-34]